jgi:hypothetical protein
MLFPFWYVGPRKIWQPLPVSSELINQIVPSSGAPLIISSRLCRVCGKSGPYNFLLKDKSDAIDEAR